MKYLNKSLTILSLYIIYIILYLNLRQDRSCTIWHDLQTLATATIWGYVYRKTIWNASIIYTMCQHDTWSPYRETITNTSIIYTMEHVVGKDVNIGNRYIGSRYSETQRTVLSLLPFCLLHFIFFCIFFFIFSSCSREFIHIFSS